ncbi:MAG: DNRLRE domain-containing protein [Candidatus Eisenbacteria bacterium]|uniref:DNRLRE domain-containing protein n=1 Tax=Eiseniibacteriota bacterium TaxID=2212470 RepID=A0A956NC28_UNCEI|nr:DNRLRE domain-containing protein [Candidatus Eisenbacteria bacterium]
MRSHLLGAALALVWLCATVVLVAFAVAAGSPGESSLSGNGSPTKDVFPSAGGEEITLEPTRDATLFFDPLGGTASGSGPTLFLGTNSQGNTRRAVLFFDLSVLPTDIVIDSVSLTLTVTNAPASDSVDVVVLPLTASWSEGASISGGGSGAPSMPGDATWIHRFYPDSSWTVAGGDVSAVSSGSFRLGPPDVYVVSGEGLAADIQSWIDGTRANHGWLLQGPEEQVSTARGIASREAVNGDTRPMLTVTYHPVSPIERTGWGTIKSRFSK